MSSISTMGALMVLPLGEHRAHALYRIVNAFRNSGETTEKSFEILDRLSCSALGTGRCHGGFLVFVGRRHCSLLQRLRLCLPHLAICRVDLARAIHLILEVSERFGLGLGGSNYGFGFVDGAPIVEERWAHCPRGVRQQPAQPYASPRTRR
jgi:hypothetical protein